MLLRKNYRIWDVQLIIFFHFLGVITGSTTTDISINDLKIDGIKNVESDRKVKAISKPH